MSIIVLFFFFFNDTATTEIYTLSLHDALPISSLWDQRAEGVRLADRRGGNGQDDLSAPRSEEHTSELQSHSDLVCRLLLEKKKKKTESGKELRGEYTDKYFYCDVRQITNQREI